MNSEVEAALKLAEEIALDRARLRKKEEAFAALLGQRGLSVVSVTRGGTAEHPRVDAVIEIPAGDGSVADRIRNFFRANPGRNVEVAEVRAAMPDVTASLIRSTTNRLAGDKYGMPGLKNVGRGQYRYRPPDGDESSEPSLFAGARRAASP